ncbi:MAG TPA: FkbM family methyltransferase [Steroidobacteraceae bacterium]|nr:FkbM family methyltransferase [Steroidobacteraceae bacterium]
MQGSEREREAGVRAEHALPLRVWRSLELAFLRWILWRRWVVARAAPFGLKVRGRPEDRIERHIFRFGCHDRALTRFVLTHLRLDQGDVAIDIGANLGWFTLLLARLARPDADVIACEPDPENFDLLRQNLKMNDAEWVIALRVALGEAAGSIQLHRYKSSNSGRHSVLQLGASSDPGITVPLTTIEALWARHDFGNRRLRFLKIDVEGYEAFVLRGAGPQLLRRCEILSLEYSVDAMRTAGIDPATVIDQLAACGMTLLIWSECTLRPITAAGLQRISRQCDLICAMPSMADGLAGHYG